MSGKAGAHESGDRARAEGGLDDRTPRARTTSRRELADVTLSQGPGKRLENLNGLVELAGGLPRFVVLCDDDVEFVRGDVVELVEECAAAGFGIGQPAHAPGSEVSHPHTRVAPRSRSREVPFVESGADLGDLARLERARATTPRLARDGLGARARVDGSAGRRLPCSESSIGCTIRHLDPVGRSYDEEPRARAGSPRTSRRAEWRT